VFREGNPIDNIRLAAELYRYGLLERLRRSRLLAHLLQENLIPGDVDHYARIVRSLAIDRGLLVASVAGPEVVQIGSPAFALLALWLTKVARSRCAEPGAGVAARLLGLLALRLPARDRERFVGEVLANLADRRRRWQRGDELLSVACAVPGLAVTLRWARRRRA
jgi:hypothetical protein